MANELDIRLFGGLRIALDGVPLADFMSHKVPALLAYLTMNEGPQRRNDLAALLWGEMPDTDARNNLRQAIANLRKTLEPHLLITRETVEFSPSSTLFLDVAAFERGLQTLSAPAVRPLQEATALYRGDFLAGFFVREAPAFEEWMLAQRARYRELALYALHTLTQLHLDAGAYDRAISDATRLLALDSWREETHRQLMLALARIGQRSAALAQYKRCRRLLWEELEVEPSDETTALYERIKASMHGPRHNLYATAPELIGREAELVELRGRLAAPSCRLLTLVGPGGAGKTQLALAAAHESLDRYLDGVWWAELGAVTNPAELVAAIGDGLGFAFAGGPLQTQLTDYLRRKELLLALDNFEHLIAPSALDLLGQILQQAPGVKLLITSRERLNLAAEWLFDVSGLPYPTNGAGEGEDYPALQLFVQRAQRIHPTFTLGPNDRAAVAHICRMTAGLPLAIELAAAWARGLSPIEMVVELERGLAFLASRAYGVPERHRSLVAVFEHSWALLDVSERTALAQLSVFRGGFEWNAAEMVAGARLPTLQTLADRSWLQIGAEGRYEMHPLVRQFTAEKLAQEPARHHVQAYGRHARHFAALTQQREDDFHGAADKQALAWMIGEADNIRAAWRWGVQQAEGALLAQFVESFLYFFDIQGRYQECVDLTGEALWAVRAAGHECETPDWGRGLGRLLALRAAFQFRLGAFEEARQAAEEALILLEPLRPFRDVGHARLYLGAAWYGLGDLNRSINWFLAAAEAYEEAGHAWGVGATLDNAGYLEFLRGDLPAAESLMKRGLEIARQTGSRYLLTGVHDHLATLMAAQRRFDEAMAHAERCREALDELDRPYIVASLSLSLGKIAEQAGDYASAASYLARALNLARSTGNRLDIVKTLTQLGGLQVAGGNLGAAERALREAATIGREIHAESLLADVAIGLADLAAARAATDSRSPTPMRP